MPSPPVRATTVKRFLKERTGMRVGTDAIDLLTELLTTAADQISDEAQQLALTDARSTLMARDIQAGFEAFLKKTGPALLSTDTIHTAIDGIGNEALTELINLLRADLQGGTP